MIHIKRERKINKFIYIYVLILIISIATICIGLKIGNTPRKENYIDFSNNWYTNNTKANLEELYKYDEVSKKLPEMENDQHLYIIVKSIMVDVYIGGEKLYSYKDYNKEFFGKTPGTYFIDLHLSKKYSNKEIKLKIDNVYQDTSGKITSAYLGNSGNIISNFIFNHLSGIIFSVVIIFIGVGYFSLYFILKMHKLISMRLFNLGMFAIFIGLFMLTDSKCLQILSGNEHVYHMISEICMLLVVVPIMQFLGRAYENSSSKKIIDSLTFLGIINFAICYLLNLVNIFDYHESLPLTHFTYIICIIYILYLCIKSLINKNKKEIIHNIGLLLICFGCLFDIIIFHFFAKVETTFFIRLGVLAFLCLEGYQFAQDILEIHRNQQRTALLQKLAYEDGLTRLLNRTSFMNDFDKLKNASQGLIAIFDVNGLKKVNDKYGHAEGDNLILTVSSALNENLSSIGKCYRIGGDEFVFISEDIIETQFKKATKKITSYLNRYNKNSDKKYTVSVATGYSIINDKIKIDQAYKIADDNMYKNKVQMKKKK